METTVLTIEGRNWNPGFVVFTGEDTYNRALKYAAERIFENELEPRLTGEDLDDARALMADEDYETILEFAAEPATEVYVLIETDPYTNPDRGADTELSDIAHDFHEHWDTMTDENKELLVRRLLDRSGA